MEGIYAAFGEVDIDPCGHVLSPVVARRRIILSEGGDGLVEDWSGRLAFVNPPFSELLSGCGALTSSGLQGMSRLSSASSR